MNKRPFTREDPSPQSGQETQQTARVESGPAAGEGLADRRTFLAGAAGLLGMIAVSSCSWEAFFQQHFRRMTQKQLEQTIKRLQADYRKKHGKEFVIGTEAPMDGTLFGYALDVQRCIGCRRCVYACVEENNLGGPPDPLHSGPQVQGRDHGPGEVNDLLRCGGGA